MIFSIDPGVNTVGVAVWDGAELSRAFLVRTEHEQAWWSVVWQTVVALRCYPISDSVLVIEKPQIYVRSRSKGDPNDLIDLALVGGAIAGATRPAEVVLYRPAEWKGQVPKPVMIERIKRSLSESERERVEIPKVRSLEHNVWDAVGIGLFHLRKTRR